MAVTSSTSVSGVVLTITGRFDFSQNDQFRRAYETHPAGSRYVVDLKRVDYLDSSALGMLLILRKHAGNTPDSVQLVGASPDVSRVLQIARFDQMFTIRAA